MREGERTGTRGQHGDEGQKLKLDQCKRQREHSPTAAEPSHPSPVSVSVHNSQCCSAVTVSLIPDELS